EAGFTELQTPILTSSSPEGARDYLVPSRVHPGKFYALPQAPQQFKQLLMTAGFDRYFQIAPCFRDEDGRADRSPGEFYQLDFEMSFVTQEDVFAAIEPVLHGVFEEFAGGATVTPAPFPRIPFAEAMTAYGSDKPDLRPRRRRALLRLRSEGRGREAGRASADTTRRRARTRRSQRLSLLLGDGLSDVRAERGHQADRVQPQPVLDAAGRTGGARGRRPADDQGVPVRHRLDRKSVV